MHENIFDVLAREIAPGQPRRPIDLEAQIHDLATKLHGLNGEPHFKVGDVVRFNPHGPYGLRGDPPMIVADIAPWDDTPPLGRDSEPGFGGLRENVTLVALDADNGCVAWHLADERALEHHHEAQDILARLLKDGELPDDWHARLRRRARQGV